MRPCRSPVVADLRRQSNDIGAADFIDHIAGSHSTALHPLHRADSGLGGLGDKARRLHYALQMFVVAVRVPDGKNVLIGSGVDHRRIPLPVAGRMSTGAFVSAAMAGKNNAKAGNSKARTGRRRTKESHGSFHSRNQCFVLITRRAVANLFAGRVFSMAKGMDRKKETKKPKKDKK